MSSFLHTQTPQGVKNRYTKNGLSSASTSALNTTAPQWAGNSYSTPQYDERNQNNSYDKGNQYNLLSASINQGSINKNMMNSQSQRYFADSHQRERNDYPNKFVFENQFNAQNQILNNSLSSHSINQKQVAPDDQHRAYNTVLKNVNNNFLNSASASENTGRIQNNSFSGQSIAQQVSNQYLQSKSVSHPANNIIHRGLHNANQINGNKFDDRNNQILLERSQQQVARDQRSISTIREQGFLHNQQNDILLKDGQQFIKSRRVLIDMLISIVVIIIAYVFYRLNSLVLNTKFSIITELKYVGALLISILSKIFTFKRKLLFF